MKYVYIIRSLSVDNTFYTGVTDDVDARLRAHNAGRVSHTSKHMPWEMKTFVCFFDDNQAWAFERYMKSASGRAFAKKRL